jgi:hypothetical protein
MSKRTYKRNTNKHRNNRGQFASLQKKAERMIGIVTILAVLFIHMHDANAKNAEHLEQLQRASVELQVRASELEQQAAKASNTIDTAEWEKKIKQSKQVNLYDFFHRYAPASDNNNPAQYAESVAKRLAVDPAMPVSTTLATRVPEFAKQIAQHEGYYASKDTIAATHNNPGNLKYIGQKGAKPGQLGFAKFKNEADGWSALERQIVRDIARIKK